MPDADAAWVHLSARLAECAAVLLDAEGGLLAADPEALALLGCSDVESAKNLWRAAARQAASLCADPAAGDARGVRGEIEMEGETPVRLTLRVLGLRGGEPRCLGLLAKIGSNADDQRLAFARKLGHDLRGPLNSMVLNLDLLRTTLEREQAEAEVAARRLRYVNAIRREIDRMNQDLTTAVEEARRTQR
jgi:signal transduction histidine kinase